MNILNRSISIKQALIPSALILSLMLGTESFAATEILKKSVIVYGDAQSEVPADEWTLSYSVHLKKKSRNEAVRVFNEIKKEIDKEAKKIKIEKKDLNVISFTVAPWIEWQKDKRVKKGYELRQAVKYRSDDLDKIGKLMNEVASLVGVSIEGLSHGLKFKTKQKSLHKLYGEAYENAKSKVDSILKASRQTFKGIDRVDELDNSSNIYYAESDSVGQYANTMMKSKRSRPKANVSLVPLNIKLKTKLKVIAKFK